MQPVSSLIQWLALDRDRTAEFNRRVLVRAGPPDLAVRNQATPNFSPVHQWAMVIHCDIRQRNALFDLGSLADVGHLQIALCDGDLAEPDYGETKSEWLKRDCIHIVAVTIPGFSILRYQIIRSCPNPLIDPATTRFSVAAGGKSQEPLIFLITRMPAISKDVSSLRIWLRLGGRLRST